MSGMTRQLHNSPSASARSNAAVLPQQTSRQARRRGSLLPDSADKAARRPLTAAA